MIPDTHAFAGDMPDPRDDDDWHEPEPSPSRFDAVVLWLAIVITGAFLFLGLLS